MIHTFWGPYCEASVFQLMKSIIVSYLLADVVGLEPMLVLCIDILAHPAANSTTSENNNKRHHWKKEPQREKNTNDTCWQYYLRWIRLFRHAWLATFASIYFRKIKYLSRIFRINMNCNLDLNFKNKKTEILILMHWSTPSVGYINSFVLLFFLIFFQRKCRQLYNRSIVVQLRRPSVLPKRFLIFSWFDKRKKERNGCANKFWVHSLLCWLFVVAVNDVSHQINA